MKICPCGSLRSHGRSLRSLPVAPVHSLLSLSPPPTLHSHQAVRAGRAGRPAVRPTSDSMPAGQPSRSGPPGGDGP